MSKAVCVACGRSIDDTAKLCPYCGANPATGERAVDTQALLQEVFRPRELTTSESVLEYARQRQGVVVTVSVAIAFLILAALHSFISSRNDNTAGDTAMPLTEITDLANRVDETRPQPMPELKFQYEGRPQMMRTYVVEPGAVNPQTPPAPPPAAAPATPR